VPGAGPDLASFTECLSDLRQRVVDDQQQQLLAELQHWCDEVCQC